MTRTRHIHKEGPLTGYSREFWTEDFKDKRYETYLDVLMVEMNCNYNFAEAMNIRTGHSKHRTMEEVRERYLRTMEAFEKVIGPDLRTGNKQNGAAMTTRRPPSARN